MVGYTIIRIIRSSALSINDWISSYATDILFVPAMCLFTLIIIRYLKSNPKIIFPWYLVLIQTIGVSIYFELYLPRYPLFGNTYTGDIWDVVMYFLGATGYLFFQQWLYPSPSHEKRIRV